MNFDLIPRAKPSNGAIEEEDQAAMEEDAQPERDDEEALFSDEDMGEVKGEESS